MTKCQFLARPNTVTVLLEYIDLFQSEWQHETISVWEGNPALYHNILLYCIVSLAIVTKYILLEFASIIPAFYSVATF